MITQAQVRDALNAIIDPCSAAAGAPAGLQDMGLIRQVALAAGPEGGTRVSVTIAVTEFGCLMGAPFAHEAYERLSALEDVEDVEVKLDDRYDWTTGDMAPAYQERLRTRRDAMNKAVPIPIRRG